MNSLTLPANLRFITRGGMRVERRTYDGAAEPLIEALDRQRGVLLSSNFDYPGRYTRWDLGFVNPPIMVTARDEFEAVREHTHGLPRSTAPAPYDSETDAPAYDDHAPGDYFAGVERAREAFKRGDLFKVVLSQTFAGPCTYSPAAIFRRLREANPSSYSALMNLGGGEFLVAD